ncbi:hypothetical protein EON63_03725 [archaeon]|nr:MAG: hypothetical protein EON63_03725 [archaeon]
MPCKLNYKAICINHTHTQTHIHTYIHTYIHTHTNIHIQTYTHVSNTIILINHIQHIPYTPLPTYTPRIICRKSYYIVTTHTFLRFL